MDPNCLRGTRLRVEPRPEWVIQRKVRNTERTDGQPVTVLLFDRQVYPDRMSRYMRHVRRLETPQAVQDAGKIELSFDPATQVMLIHGISIFRAGKLMNHAKLEDFKIIQRERGLEMGIYDGNITALMLLKDLRTGDIIDIETSVTSDDDIFSGHYWFMENFEYVVPVYRQYFSWLSSNQSRFTVDESHMDVKALEEETPYGICKVWNKERTPGVELPPHIPSGLNPFKHLSITSFSNWREVAGAYYRLWERTENPGMELPKEVQALKDRHPTDAVALIEAVVEFVRDQIRYQGVETGRLGLVPDDLHAIWERRFGDCKEKTSVLCWMLRECGYDATPALVSTVLRERIIDQLPAPIFDHVVVHLHFDGLDHWIDPTDMSQRGKLSDWDSLPYGKALLISQETKDFLVIPNAKLGKNRLVVVEEYDFANDGCDAEISVKHTYHGTEANRVRHSLDSQGRSVTQQIFTEIVKSTRANAELITDLEITDDQAKNVITLSAKFRAMETLMQRGNTGMASANFVPHSMIGRIVGIDDRERTHPLGLIHPVDIEHTTVLRHSAAKSSKVPKVIVDNEFIKFVAGSEKNGEFPSLNYVYLTKSPEVPVEHLPRYRVHLKQIDQLISLTFETNMKTRFPKQTKSYAAAGKTNWQEMETGQRQSRRRSYQPVERSRNTNKITFWIIFAVVIFLIKIIAKIFIWND